MNFRFLDKLGSIGAILAAATCSVCFPFLALIGSAVGLGVFGKYEGITLFIFQALVFIALIGNVVSYLNHKKIFPLIMGVVSPFLIFFSFYLYFNQLIIYAGLLGLLVTAVLNYLENRRRKACEV